MKNAIIYLHGFNSASLDLAGNLLVSKQKLMVLDAFCKVHDIIFFTPNIDYREFSQVIGFLTQSFKQLKDQGYRVVFMGSSLGGFTSEYMAMKMNSKALMINPALTPSVLLAQFIGVSENFETHESFHWTQAHCQQFEPYQAELGQVFNTQGNRTIFVDLADELIDSVKTVKKYHAIADVHSYEGGSHGFEHIEQAMPVIKEIILN